MATTKDFKQGHRERVRARFLREGLRPFQDYEVLELLLFYAVPRRDTKPMAHALIDRFGSLDRVLHANVSELCTVDGIGKRTAEFLLAVFPFMQYVARKEPHTEVYDTERTLAAYFYERFNKIKPTGCALVLLNNRNEVIRHLLLEEKSCISLITTGKLAHLAFSYRASQIAFADYKADGIPFPDGALMQSISSLRDELLSVGIHMQNYLILVGKQYNSVLRMLEGSILDSAPPLFVDAQDTTRHSFNEDTRKTLSGILRSVLPEEKADAFASSLLSKYGTIATVLSVPYQTLVDENEEYASALLFLRIVAESYTSANLSRVRGKRSIYRTAEEMGNMFCDVIGTNCEETVALGLFDADMRLIDIVFCAQGSVNTASVVMRSVAETAIAHRAKFVAIAHNHPSGVTDPSAADFALTNAVYEALHRVGVSFLDHFVVTEREALPISRHGFHRYTDADDTFYE